MQYYTIHFIFRGKERTGHVHKRSTYFAIHFSDLEIIRDFGSRIVFQKSGEVSHYKEGISDEQEFFSAVKRQLK